MRFHWPTGASVFAGLLGAGVVDAMLVLARGSGAPLFAVLALAVGLYGVAGLVGAALGGWAVGTVLGALPSGPRDVTVDVATDTRLCGALLAGLAGALALAVGAAAAHGLFVASMASRTLAVIATGGLVLALCPLGLVV